MELLLDLWLTRDRKLKMACNTSTSSSDLSECSNEPVIGDVEYENDKTLDARHKRSKKPPARYLEAFQSDKEKLEFEMKDSKSSEKLCS